MKILIISLALMACGTDKKSNDGGPTAIPLDDGTVEIGAQLIRPGETFPACDAPGKGRLVYDVADKAFYFCDESAGWVFIDLQGKDGADGADGLNGRDGRDGRDGVAGKDGTNGKDGELPPTLWVNPISNQKFVLVHSTSFSSILASYPCPTGSKKPTEGFWGAYWHFKQEFVFDASGTALSAYGAKTGTGIFYIQQANFGSTAILPFICEVSQ